MSIKTVTYNNKKIFSNARGVNPLQLFARHRASGCDRAAEKGDILGARNTSDLFGIVWYLPDGLELLLCRALEGSARPPRGRPRRLA